MASVYLKCSTWYARFKAPTGAWRSQATKAANKTEAKRLALDLERQAERQRFGLEPLSAESTLRNRVAGRRAANLVECMLRG